MKNNSITVGDVVRVSKDAPRIYFRNSFEVYSRYDMTVVEVEDGCARVNKSAGITLFELIIPTKYLCKVNAEPKNEPKFKVGDKAVVTQGLGKTEIVTIAYYDKLQDAYRVEFDNENAVGNLWYEESDLLPYTSPSEPEKPSEEVKVGDVIDTPKGKGKVIVAVNGLVMAQLDNGDWWQCLKAEIPSQEEMLNDLDPARHKIICDGVPEPTFIMLWDYYTAQLAHDIAVKLVNKNTTDFSEAGANAVKVAKAVVEGLKRK